MIYKYKNRALEGKRADNVKLERTIKQFLKNIKFQLVRARKASVVWSYPFLLLFGGAAFDGVDGEAVSLAAGLALSLGVNVNQGADGAADHGGVVTSGDAAGREGCRNNTDGESEICWGAPKISEQKCASLKSLNPLSHQHTSHRFTSLTSNKPNNVRD